LQISGFVQLQEDYKTAQKISEKRPPHGTGPPEKVTNVEFQHFGPNLPLPLTLMTGDKQFMMCYTAYDRL